MKISMNWPGNRPTHKKKRARHKPKIRWQLLGLTDPAEEDTSVSMDEIRRQVVIMSHRGIGQGARSRPDVRNAPIDGVHDQADPKRKRRRGATE